MAADVRAAESTFPPPMEKIHDAHGVPTDGERQHNAGIHVTPLKSVRRGARRR